MEPSMFLTDEEIISLTQKKRRATQRHVLNAIGITHKIRPDGSLVVLRSHVEKVLGGGGASLVSVEPDPNWAALAQPLPRPTPNPKLTSHKQRKSKARA